jgi:hypothetical protein
LGEGGHLSASNPRANVLENLAVGISVRQNGAPQGWSTVASASFGSMTSLARRIVHLAAGVVRIRIASEWILLRLGNVLLRHQAWETAQQARDQPGEAVSPRIVNHQSSMHPNAGCSTDHLQDYSLTAHQSSILPISISLALWGGSRKPATVIGVDSLESSVFSYP